MVQAIDRKMFFLIGRNDNVKSLVSIGNVVAAVEFMLRNSKPGLHTYNLVDRESFSVRKIASMVAAELGSSSPIRSIPPTMAWLAAELGEVCRQVLGANPPLTRARLEAMLESTHFSADKLMAAGFVHPQDTKEGLREMVAWYLSSKGDSSKCTGNFIKGPRGIEE
jgi:nucleoside-diphosphate-sugar epimerase